MTDSRNLFLICLDISERFMMTVKRKRNGLIALRERQESFPKRTADFMKMSVEQIMVSMTGLIVMIVTDSVIFQMNLRTEGCL